MMGKLLKVLILIGLLVSTYNCGKVDEAQISYIECCEEIIEFSQNIDPQSASNPEKLKQELLQIFQRHGYQDLYEFKAAINKYEDEPQKEKLANILEQLTGETSLSDIKSFSSKASQRRISDFLKIGGKAISLKVLQQKLQENHGKPLPKSLSQLCGINQILGYLVDDRNKDVILIGSVDKTLPPMYLEDFVIALRNAWLKYARLEGNTYYYSHPGCTIDPDPAVLQKLDDVGDQMNRSRDTCEVEKAIDQWKKICISPQKVGVFGIPFDTRFSWVMLKADYDMKRLVNGSDPLDIKGFSSLIEMELEQAKKDIQEGKSMSVSISGLNRFWFYPGENRYQVDEKENLVMIEKCPVVLLTEEEHLTKSGKVVGSGRPNPYAQKFTKIFSALYAEIAKQRPIYQELENLFRFVALARILKLKSPQTRVGLNIDYLLNQYPIRPTLVKKFLPGRSNVKGFKHQTDSLEGSHIYQLWLPSCGGVTIAVEPKEEDFLKEQTDNIAKLKENVLEARPSANELSWDFPGESGGSLPEQSPPEGYPVKDQTISIDLIPLLKDNINLKSYSNYIKSIYGI